MIREELLPIKPVARVVLDGIGMFGLEVLEIYESSYNFEEFHKFQLDVAIDFVIL